jgi:hypothetical protein
MKKVIILTFILGTFAATVRGDTIFDNSANDIHVRFNPGTYEVGDEVILNGNARYLTNFSFEFWGTNTIADGNPLFSGNVQCSVRFYKNDGTPFNGYATPGTCFWASDWFNVFPTVRNTLVFRSGVDFPASGIYVPSSDITWSVQFRGMSATDQVGVDFFSPGVVGLNFPDYWLKNGPSWQLLTNSVASDFAAKMEGAFMPTPAVPTVFIAKKGINAIVSWPGWATNYVLQSSQRVGVGASWFNVPNRVVWTDNNFVTTNQIASSGSVFFRLRQVP